MKLKTTNIMKYYLIVLIIGNIQYYVCGIRGKKVEITPKSGKAYAHKYWSKKVAENALIRVKERFSNLRYKPTEYEIEENEITTTN